MKNDDDHSFLCGVVSIWLCSGHTPVKANDAAGLIEAEFWDTTEMVETAIDRGHLMWAREPKPNDWERPDVIPTIQGVMEVLSS